MPDASEHIREDSCVGAAFLQDRCINKLGGWTDWGFLNRQHVFMSLPTNRSDDLLILGELAGK